MPQNTICHRLSCACHRPGASDTLAQLAVDLRAGWGEVVVFVVEQCLGSPQAGLPVWFWAMQVAEGGL